MDLDLIGKVVLWAINRGLHRSDSDKQLLKLQEELGELTQAHLKQNRDQIADSIGDLMVVLEIYCLQQGFDLNGCFQKAYDTIENRTGKMINGVFVKTADLPTADKN